MVPILQGTRRLAPAEEQEAMRVQAAEAEGWSTGIIS